MIDQEKINIVITEGLKEATGCEVVKANLSKAPIPPYPYFSFTVLNTDTGKGTYSETGEIRFIALTQTWSFTAQGDKDNETQLVAMRAKDWLEKAGRLYLNDHKIVVKKVGAITNRDTLLTVQYEYRKGFDVVLSLLNIVEETGEIIEKAKIEKE